MHWPEYFMLIDPTVNVESMISSEKFEILRRHPVEAVMFFKRRLDCFISNIIMGKAKPLSDVKDYWIRIGFQIKSPHVHSFWWIDGAPNVDTIEGRQQAPQLIDQYISTVIPSQSDNPELHHLVQTLQVHRHSPICYKYNRIACRFEYLRIVSNETRLRD